MDNNKATMWHFAALFAVIIWGVTFVSTKVLINSGLTPVEIFIYRFVIAYVGIWIMSPKKLVADKYKDELLMAVGGVMGGSLYFLTENTALEYTFASNVSLIIATTPILTAIVTRLFYKGERLSNKLMIGLVMALSGVALVVFNGQFILRLSPIGDILTLIAALCWAFYSVVVRKLSKKYSTVFITRKIFFYGIITILPYLFVRGTHFNFSLLSNSVVWMNIIFLGVIASLACYLLWNDAMKKLGIIKASNYLYFIPVVTLIVSSLVINEKITIIAILGAVLILYGVWFAENGFAFRRKGK